MVSRQVTVAVTGAAGAIGYATLFRIASGQARPESARAPVFFLGGRAWARVRQLGVGHACAGACELAAWAVGLASGLLDLRADAAWSNASDGADAWT